MKEVIHLKRIYEEPADTDGLRILVDRLWPRGLKKENLNIDKWAKDVAPSPALRKWFDHDPEKWDSFSEKYTGELKDNPAVDEVLRLAKNNHIVTLLYTAHSEQYNHAIILQDFLKKKIEIGQKDRHTS